MKSIVGRGDWKSVPRSRATGRVKSSQFPKVQRDKENRMHVGRDGENLGG